MRISEASLAIISLKIKGQTHWLSQWNEGWSAYSFVGGHREKDESFRECCIREVSEELHLQENEFTIPKKPITKLEYEAFSDRAKTNTRYIMCIYEPSFSHKNVFSLLENDPLNKWLTLDEIKSGKSADGKLVSRTIKFIFSKLCYL